LYPSNQARTRAQTANTAGSESPADSKTAAVSR
jgi:hypothetical protein